MSRHINNSDSDLRKFVLALREQEKKKQLRLSEQKKERELKTIKEWIYLEKKANRLDNDFIDNGSVLVLTKDYKTGWFGYVRVLYGKRIGFGSMKLI